MEHTARDTEVDKRRLGQDKVMTSTVVGANLTPHQTSAGTARLHPTLPSMHLPRKETERVKEREKERGEGGDMGGGGSDRQAHRQRERERERDGGHSECVLKI